MLEIIPLKEKHLEDAALLDSNRYQRLCEQETHLPHRYSEVDNLLLLLQNIMKETRLELQRSAQIGFMVG